MNNNKIDDIEVLEKVNEDQACLIFILISISKEILLFLTLR